MTPQFAELNRLALAFSDGSTITVARAFTLVGSIGQSSAVVNSISFERFDGYH